MERRNLAGALGMETELVRKACNLATEAQSATNNRPYLLENSSRYAIFAFRGTGTVSDWYSGSENPFGSKSVDLNLFRSLRSIGNDVTAAVNCNFLNQFRSLLKDDIRSAEDRRFEDLLKDSKLGNEVRKAVNEKRTVIFTGYSSGGPIAILATVLFLQQNHIPAWCVTFGSPLVGDQIFGHAIRRENWASCFLHFVLRYDLMPRVLLSPLSAINGKLQTLLPCYTTQMEPIAKSQEALSTFHDIVRNVSSLASHTACSFMGCTNSLLQAVGSFVPLSPYRPFGTYVFCTGNGRTFTIKNPDAILQLLFYSLQLENLEAVQEISYKSFKDHLHYVSEISGSLGREDVVDLEHLLLQLPLSPASASGNDTFVRELGLSTRAMLCLTAAREAQKQKQRNQERIDNNSGKIKEALRKLQEYKTRGEMREVGYYDAFKLQKEAEDFQANVTRLELAGIWDEIIEMLKRYELPDTFEGTKEWIELGTKFRRLMEPLDIANYYRHSKDEDTGAYMQPKKDRQPRPKRYRYTQRWLEYADHKPVDYYSESCFWAKVEDLRIHTNKHMEGVPQLDKDVSQWVQAGFLGREVFFEKTTLVNWWEKLTPQLRNGTRIAALVQGEVKHLGFSTV